MISAYLVRDGLIPRAGDCGLVGEIKEQQRELLLGRVNEAIPNCIRGETFTSGPHRNQMRHSLYSCTRHWSYSTHWVIKLNRKRSL